MTVTQPPDPPPPAAVTVAATITAKTCTADESKQVFWPAAPLALYRGNTINREFGNDDPSLDTKLCIGGAIKNR
jgi:hypothetical protein